MECQVLFYQAYNEETNLNNEILAYAGKGFPMFTHLLLINT